MKLSKRLETVISLMPGGDTAADVGTDHARVPIELVQRGVYARVIAMDVRKGPLEGAAKHVSEAGLSEQIELRLADGLKKLLPGEAETISISGMGGPLMERILTEGRETAWAAQALVLSPQSDLPHFRRFLCEQGFSLVKERLILDEGKYYSVMLVKPGIAEGPHTEAEYRFGWSLAPEDRETLYGLLKWELAVTEDVLRQLEGKMGPAAADKRAEKEKFQTLLKECLKAMEEKIR